MRKELGVEQRPNYGDLQRSRERLAHLLRETLAEPQASKEHLQRVIEELATGMEELLVAEEELRTQAEELRASTAAIDAERERCGELFESASDAYLVTDTQGKILEANSSASRMLGVPERFITGKLLSNLVAEPNRRQLRDLMVAQVRADTDAVPEVHSLRLQPSEREPFDAEMRVVMRRPSRSSPPHILWMVRDISQRLRLEEEVRFLHGEVDLLASLGHVARLTASPEPAETLLGRMTALAAQALSGCEVSIALAAADGTRFPASAGERAGLLDKAAQEQGDGPCLTAIRESRVVEATLEECRRWPIFAAAGEEVGLASANAYPISTAGGRRGALNVYSFRLLTEAERALIPLLADQVVLALDNLDVYESARTLAGHLERALESRGVIEQAKGILMARQGCSDDEAFDILRRASQRMNRKLRDVASDLVVQVRVNQPKRGAHHVAEPDEAGRRASISRAARLEEQARRRAAEERQRADVAREAG